MFLNTKTLLQTYFLKLKMTYLWKYLNPNLNIIVQWIFFKNLKKNKNIFSKIFPNK
jgi:hypothetical protein